MEDSADLGGCSPPPSASVDNTTLDLQNFSYATQPHSIIAKYCRLSWYYIIDIYGLRQLITEPTSNSVFLNF